MRTSAIVDIILGIVHKYHQYFLYTIWLVGLFGAGFITSWIVIVKGVEITSWIKALSQNEVDIMVAVIGGMTAVIAAFVGVWVAFDQIKKQFEHKVIHAAWQDFQEKLFEFSSSLTEFGSKVSWLTYFIENQNNPLVNGGDLVRHRTHKWNELNDSHQKLMQSFVRLLQSFETHEVVFLSLKKMKRVFNEECEVISVEKYMDFTEAIFPEFYGQSQTKTLIEMQEHITSLWKKTIDISTYLDDFRRELQNETVGKILKRRLEKRQPTESCKILTKRGFLAFHP